MIPTVWPLKYLTQQGENINVDVNSLYIHDLGSPKYNHVKVARYKTTQNTQKMHVIICLL